MSYLLLRRTQQILSVTTAKDEEIYEFHYQIYFCRDDMFNRSSSVLFYVFLSPSLISYPALTLSTSPSRSVFLQHGQNLLMYRPYHLKRNK